METIGPMFYNDRLKRLFFKKLNPKPQGASCHRNDRGTEGSKDWTGYDNVLQPLHIRYTGSFQLDSESKVEQPVIKRKRIRNINQEVDIIDLTKLDSSAVLSSLQRRRFRVRMMFEDSNKEDGLKKCRIKLHNVELLTENSNALKETEVEQLIPLLDAIIKDIVGQVRSQIAETFKEEEETGIQCDLSDNADENCVKNLSSDDDAHFFRKQVFNKHIAHQSNDFEKDKSSTPQTLLNGDYRNLQTAEVMVDVQSTSRTTREKQRHQNSTQQENCIIPDGKAPIPHQRKNCMVLTAQKTQSENSVDSFRPTTSRNESTTCQKYPQHGNGLNSKSPGNSHMIERASRSFMPPTTETNEAHHPSKNMTFHEASGIPLPNRNHSWHPLSKQTQQQQQIANSSNKASNLDGSINNSHFSNNLLERHPQAYRYLQQHPNLLQQFQNREQMKQEQFRKQQIFQLQRHNSKIDSSSSKLNQCVFLRAHHEAPVQHRPPYPSRPSDAAFIENGQSRHFLQQPPRLMTSKVAGESRYPQPRTPAVSRNNNQIPQFLYPCANSQIRPNAQSLMTAKLFDRMPAPRIRFSTPTRQPVIVDASSGNDSVRHNGQGQVLQMQKNQPSTGYPQPLLTRRHQQNPKPEVCDPSFIAEDRPPNSRPIEDQKPSICQVSVETRQSRNPDCEVNFVPESSRFRNAADLRQRDHPVSQSPYTPTPKLDRNGETDVNSKHLNSFYCQTFAADADDVIDSDREISTTEISESRQQDLSTSVFTEIIPADQRENQCPQVLNFARSNKHATSDALLVNEMTSMTSWNEYTTGDETVEPVTEEMNGLMDLSEQDHQLTEWMAACLPSEMSGGKRILHINDEPDLQLVSDHLDTDATANTHSVDSKFLDHCNQEIGSDFSKGVLSQWNDCFPILEYDGCPFECPLRKKPTSSRLSNSKQAWKMANKI